MFAMRLAIRGFMRVLALAFMFGLLVVFFLQPVSAAPYAAMVMDARNGEVLYSRNANTRLHPASLTKMMTLYIAFEAVENGEIGLDQLVRISRAAEAEPPSELGLKAGQRIAFRYLIRAAAIKSANDAATAIAEALEGSEAAFARRMNRTARAMGMRRTNFHNAHGLTESGHLSTARDMTILGRHMIYDYPEYYNIFSRERTNAGLKHVNNTNRRLLTSYRGADGIKTGYTRAAGSNLVASAARGSERIIVTVFGGQSSAWRDAHVAQLLDLGFERAPRRVALRRPARPRYQGSIRNSRRSNAQIRPLSDNFRPVARPGSSTEERFAALGSTVPVEAGAAATISSGIRPPENRPDVQAVEGAVASAAIAVAVADNQRASSSASAASTASQPSLASAGVQSGVRPMLRAKSVGGRPARGAVTLASISEAGADGERNWSINLGRYSTRFDAEQAVIRGSLSEASMLQGTSRNIRQGATGFDAILSGLSRDAAEQACNRLQARGQTCFMLAPS